jgi:hypothetical protein
MERSRGQLLDGERILFDQVEGPIAIKKTPSIGEWPGRFWLPADDRVESRRNDCLTGGDGRAGELTVDCFEPERRPSGSIQPEPGTGGPCASGWRRTC